MSSKGSAVQEETRVDGLHHPETNDTNGVYTEEKPRRRHSFVAFLKKWWWLLLIIFVIGVLAISLPVFLVAVPKMIQDKVNDAVLEMQGLRVTDPKADSVYIEINSTLAMDASISATVDGFNASLYLEDKTPHTPFAYVQMPSTQSASLISINVSQTIQITDMQAFADYNTWFLMNESFRMTLSGNTYVHVKGLRAAPISFAKTITVTGLNSLKGLNVTSSRITATPDAQGDNFFGFSDVPNPSILTVELGNATFATMFNNTNIGNLYIDNMYLYPGNNNLSIRANVSQIPVVTAVTTQPYCQNGTIPLDIIGTSVVSNGVALPYYEAGFKQNVESLTLNVTADLGAALGSFALFHCPTSS
jgi:hypothetical protein